MSTVPNECITTRFSISGGSIGTTAFGLCLYRLSLDAFDPGSDDDRSSTVTPENDPIRTTENMGDPYDLNRFVEAQAADYARTLSEIKGGLKRSHWMWYIFPQLEGLGSSPMSRRYAIKTEREAQAYLAHPMLGKRLIECMEAVLGVTGRSALEILGLEVERQAGNRLIKCIGYRFIVTL